MNKNLYMCIAESLCCIPETNTTFQINYTSIKKKRNLDIEIENRFSTSLSNCFSGSVKV